jgi:hypothetical protein
MRGLYLNCDGTNIPASIELAKKYSKIFVFPEALGKGQVIYNADEWPSEPIFTYNTHTFIVAGWFIYRGKRNNIEQLAKDVISEGIKAINNVDIGSFVIYWHHDSQTSIIVDPIGLSSHYIDLHAKQLTIAPSVKVLFDEGKHTVNPIMVSILNKKDHLFGDYTIYNEIERLTPATVYANADKLSYGSLDKDLIEPIEDLGKHITSLGEFWSEQEKILPISSGLDSRFILANCQFANGFTYGPDNSPEINISKQFSAEFSDYYHYDYCMPPLYKDDQQVNAEMSFGVLKPIDRLLTNYIHVKERFKHANAFFDGYCGDVFQRGTFLNFKGKLGEIFKIFPWYYRLLNWDAETMLRKRHQVLSDEEFLLFYNDYKKRTAHLALTDSQKVTYYEYLFNRGGRYAIYGSNILAAQVFTIVSPFSHRVILTSLLHQDFFDGVTYKTMKKLWRNMPTRYRNKKVESGYKPESSILLIPFIQIIYRLMFHFIPSRANYGVKMRRAQKKAGK